MNKIKVPFWIPTLSVFIGLFICNYLYVHSNFTLANFNNRTIGIAVLNGIDIAARSTFYLKLIFIFNITFFGLVKILKTIQSVAEKKMGIKSAQADGDKLFAISIVSIFILLFHYVNGDEVFVYGLDTLKIILVLHFVIYIVKIIIKSKDTILFNLLDNNDLVNLSFLLPLIPFFIRWLVINGSFILNAKLIPYYIGLWFTYWLMLRIVNIFLNKKLFSLHVISILKASIPLLLIPISITISNEIQYTFSNVLNWPARQFALVNIAILFILSLTLFIFNKSKNINFNFSKFIFFPILISTIALFNLHSNFLEISYLDIFHNGENLISNQQFWEFNKIPFINIYPTHGFSYLLSQMLYSLLNGYQMFSPWLLEWLPKIFELLLLYFALSKITSSFFSVITIVFMPILGIFGGQALVYGYSRSMPTTYYLTAFLAGLVLVSIKNKINFRSSFLIWVTCIFTTAWRIDFGIGSFISVAVIQLISILEPSKKYSVRLTQFKDLFNSLFISLIIAVLILFSLSIVTSISLIDIFNNIFQFVKFQGQAQGLSQVINDYTPIAIFQYFILPSIAVFYISKYIYNIFIKKNTFQPDYKRFLVYLSIFSLVIFVRSFQRQTLSVLGYNPYLFIFLMLFLPIFISNKKNKISIIFFTIGLFIYQLILPNANVLMKTGQMIQLYNWKNKETRVHVNDNQYKMIAGFINSNLEQNQTFVDLSSSPLLYVVTNRKFINYFIPSAYYTSDIIQQNIVNQLDSSYSKAEIPIVILKQPIPEANSIDGVPNEIRSYKVYEYIHKKYKPVGYVDGYMVWIANNFSLKDDSGLVKTKDITYENNLAKLPFYWGQHDPYQNKYKTTTVQNIIDKPIKIQTDIPKSIKIRKIKEDATGVYINLKIISKDAGKLKLKYGTSSHTIFELIQSEKPINYMIRISSQYKWKDMIEEKFEVIPNVDVEITEAQLIREDRL